MLLQQSVRHSVFATSIALSCLVYVNCAAGASAAPAQGQPGKTVSVKAGSRPSAGVSAPGARSAAVRATVRTPASAKPVGANALDSKTFGEKSLFGRSSKAAPAGQEFGSKQSRVPNADAKNAPMISWLPSDGVKPRVAMLCIHGFSLHKGCYAALGTALSKKGVATYAIDMRGFGELKDSSNHGGLDFDGSIVDIKAALERIRKEQPGLPVVILGESMGGAVALKVAALYPELVSGLISSVPARDRFSMSEDERNVGLKAGLQTIVGGFSKPMTNAAAAAVHKISEKEEVRSQWATDPLMRNDFSPKEFVQLDKFMSRNLETAERVKDTPVLFIQGTNDKLIRPAGTWKLFERLATPNRQLVLSKNSEHLIFEEGQFRQDDLNFVLSWIDGNIAALEEISGEKKKLPVVASKEEFSGPLPGVETEESAMIASVTGKGKNMTRGLAPDSTPAIASIPPPPAATEFKNRIATNSRPKISYWIELFRGGKVFRCNNKMEFKTGDAIRFHLIPESDGYAYLVMKTSTTGKSDVLFPNKTYGLNNFLRKGQDHPIPSQGWMAFDGNAGTEQLGLVFGQEKIAVTPEMLKNGTLTAFVSPSQSGSKDLCPTRMKLSWDDPMPVMLPDDFSPLSQVASSAAGSSLVRLMATSGGMVSANIQLMHGK